MSESQVDAQSQEADLEKSEGPSPSQGSPKASEKQDEFEIDEVELSESDGNFVMEEISDVTETESLGTMDDFEKLKDKTRKLKIIETEETETCKSTREECADEFLRNFFIKFGMKKTLDIFD